MKASIVFEDCDEGVQFRLETDPPLVNTEQVSYAVMVACMWMERMAEELKGELRTHAVH